MVFDAFLTPVTIGKFPHNYIGSKHTLNKVIIKIRGWMEQTSVQLFFVFVKLTS
jgi:hypothetical protein